jgi:hypothetical protein
MGLTMVTLQVVVAGDTVYEAKTDVVPRVEDRVQRGDHSYRVESVVWHFADGGAEPTVVVTAEDRPYTF